MEWNGSNSVVMGSGSGVGLLMERGLEEVSCSSNSLSSSLSSSLFSTPPLSTREPVLTLFSRDDADVQDNGRFLLRLAGRSAVLPAPPAADVRSDHYPRPVATVGGYVAGCRFLSISH